ncbi:MAG: META domain-containing protein [Zoogloeaceae bacterium]|jgi:heat shock protein HslJ|nr:META domain-containing protein [Zoogloeaceae bacterium]
MYSIQKLLLTFSLCSLAACNNLQVVQPSVPDAAPTDAAQVALAGIYAGDLPCADCAGQHWRLVLNADQRYQLHLAYAGKGTAELTGYWRPGEEDKIYLNDDGAENIVFQVEENRLHLLDEDEQPIVSQFNYTLERQPDTVLQRTNWRLVRLENQVVTTPKPIQLRLDDQDRFSGFGGCNRIMGIYQQIADELMFSQTAGTQMACIGDAMAVENAFLKALTQVENWETRGQTLYLRDATGKVLLELEAETEARK